MLRISAPLLCAAVLISAPARAEPQTYTLDPEHFTIAFMAQHAGFARVLGQFREAEGTVVFDEEAPELRSISVTVNTDSVDTGHRGRDRHLRSADFLNVREYPEMTFVMTGAEQTGERTGTVTGDLTVRGETHPIKLDVVWIKSANYTFEDYHYALGISARGALQRSDWGMTYGIADGLVGNDVQILIEAELIRED